MQIGSYWGTNPYSAWYAMERGGLTSARSSAQTLSTLGSSSSLLPMGSNPMAVRYGLLRDGLSSLKPSLHAFNSPTSQPMYTQATPSSDATAVSSKQPARLLGQLSIRKAAGSGANYATVTGGRLTLNTSPIAAQGAQLTTNSLRLDSSSKTTPTYAGLTFRPVQLNAPDTTGSTRASLTGGTVTLDSAGATPAVAAVLTAGKASLDPSGAIAQTTATMHGASVTLDNTGTHGATTASLTFGAVQLSMDDGSHSTRASLTGGSVTLDTSGAHAATTATLTSGSLALDTSGATTLTTASMQGVSVTLDTSGTHGATYASMTFGSVALDASGTTNFGVVNVNGVSTDLGSFDNTGKTTADAAQYLADTFNANTDNTVTATVGGTYNDQLIFTAKTAGSAGSFTVAASGIDYNGLSPGASATGLDAGTGQTDFGTFFVNGESTYIGAFDNTGKTTADAAQFIVDTLNANSANAFTASVGGAGNDQLVFTSKTAGAAGTFTVGAAASWTGITAGTATGTDTSAGQTDLGSVTINGVSTSLGTFENAGKSNQDLAQYVVDTLNANGANSFTASLGGAGNDQVVLTSKSIGTAGNFSIDSSSSALNGLTAGSTATGIDAAAGQTDLGAITINGVTTQLGIFDNTGKTAADAAQYIVDTLNANGALGATASVGGASHDKVVLSAKSLGVNGSFAVDDVTRSRVGFGAGQAAWGTGETPGFTAFGQVTINGVTTDLGSFDNTGKTASDAAQYLADRINANTDNAVTASVGGSGHDQIVLTAKTAGSAGSFTLAASGTAYNSLSPGASATGEDAITGQTDFGTFFVNGEATYIGVFDNAGKTAADAARFIADTLNANSANAFTASVGGASHDQLIFTSKTAGAAGTFTVGAAASQMGITPGTATGVDASAGQTNLGSVTINGVTTQLGTFDNTGATALMASQHIVDTLNANDANVFTASLGGASHDQIVLTSKTAGTAGNLSITASSGAFNGLSVGSTAVGTDANAGQTVFGVVTINGISTDLGSFDNNGKTAQDAAQVLVDRFNANSDNTLTASVGGTDNDQVVLSAKTVGTDGNFLIENVSNFTGFRIGQGGSGSGASPGFTNLGSVNIDGVTTDFGAYDNTGKTASDAAQYLADTINANADNKVAASVGGSNHDQLILTAKTAGAAGGFTLAASGTAYNGLSEGASATGEDGNAGQTDLGQVTISGVTTYLGAFDNAGKTAKDLTQYLVDTLNANPYNTFTASVTGRNQDQVSLTSKDQGASASLKVDSTTSTFNGLTAGTRANGQNALIGKTDLGTLTIGGVSTTLGIFNNTGQTAATAAQFVANTLNANTANVVTASVGGANHDQLVLTAKTAGSAGGFFIADANVATGFQPGEWATAQDGLGSTTDYGSVTINGISTQFGTVDNSRFSAGAAAEYLATRLNETNSTIRAQVENGKLAIYSRDTGMGATIQIDALQSDSDGNSANDQSIGLYAGTSAAGTETTQLGTSTPAPGSTLNPAFVEGLVKQAGIFTRGVNQYLDLISAGNAAPGIGTFSQDVITALGPVNGALSNLGFKIQNFRLTFDATALRSAIEAAPTSVTNSLQQLQQSLSSTIQTHEGTLDTLQSTAASGATGGNLSSISSAYVAQQSLSNQSSKLWTLMSSVTKLQLQMNGQSSLIAQQYQLFTGLTGAT